MADKAAEFIRLLGVTQVGLLGFSLGGDVAEMAIIHVKIVAAVKQRYRAFLSLPGKFMKAMMLEILAAPVVGTVPSQLPRQLPWSSSDVCAVLRDV